MGLLVFIIGIIITINAIVDKTTAWHSANDVLISINNFAMTLQEAIDNEFLVECAQEPNQSYTLQPPEPNHQMDRIWISIDGSEMSLQEAISTTSFCGNSITNSYNNDINPGHLASEIEILMNGSEMSLQDAIDTGEFCPTSHAYSSCYNNSEYWYNLCGEREEIIKVCDTSLQIIGDYYCSNNDVYRNYTDEICLNNSCTLNPNQIRILEQDCGIQECSNGQCIRQCNWVNSGSCNTAAEAYVNWFVGDFDDCANWCRARSTNRICCYFSTGAPTGFQQCSFRHNTAIRMWTTSNGWWYNYCIIPPCIKT